MIKVDSEALLIVQRALGLTGRPSRITEFLDGQLEQTFDVLPAVRRSRTLAITEGIFVGVMRNVHGAADSQVSTIDPYAPGVVNAHAPYPGTVGKSFDIWLIQATAVQVSGTGTLTALLDIQLGVQGWGVDDAGADVTSAPTMPLALWTGLITKGAIEMGLLEGSGVPVAKLGLRIPRTSTPVLAFRTTSTAIATFQLNLILALFPVSLGQDAAY